MAAFAISSLFPFLCKGYRLDYFSLLNDNFYIPAVPWIGPGQIPTTLIPFGPSYTARCFVIASTPALAVPEWICKAQPL